MKIAICDDEYDYMKDIEKHINQYCIEHGLSVDIYKYNNGNILVTQDIRFDIAFLDIEMDDLNGIQIGKELKSKNPDMVLIYVTAYEHYLDEALDIGVTRFFNKPINSQRFYQGLEKAINKVDNTEIGFHLKDQDNGTVTLRANDIVFVEIKGRKTKVIDKNDKEYYAKDNIKEWKNKLTKSFFVSPHNSFIVNTNYITYFQKDYIVLNGKYNVPIAYSKRVEFKRRFMMLMEG